MRYSQKNNRGGFTLVELLVVLTIIAILAALIFPAANNAIAHAKTTKCSSNLHQIGVAMLAFAADNNNNLPVSGGAIHYNPTSGQQGWCQQIEPYVGMGQGQGGAGTIFQCPDSSFSIPVNVNYAYFNGAHAAFIQAGGNPSVGVNLIKMGNLSRYIMAGDIAFTTGLTDPLDCDKDDMSQDPAFNYGTATTPTKIPIHMGQSNVLFGDGHVEALRYFDITQEMTVYGGNKTDYTH